MKNPPAGQKNTGRPARWLISGSVASVTSAAMLALLGLRRKRPAAGINGPSQWIYGRFAASHKGFDLRHTMTGYLVHHASSFLWGSVFESPPMRAGIRNSAARAVVVSTLAATVDYTIVPQRFRPGFEAHFRPRQIVWVYAAFAAGLVLSSQIGRRTSDRA